MAAVSVSEPVTAGQTYFGISRLSREFRLDRRTVAKRLEGVQPNGNGEGLRVLVEKDFPCLTARPNEDDSDAFPWPEKKD